MSTAMWQLSYSSRVIGMLDNLKRAGRVFAIILFFCIAWMLNLLILGFIGILIFNGEDGIRDVISYVFVFLLPIAIASVETITLQKHLANKRASRNPARNRTPSPLPSYQHLRSARGIYQAPNTGDLVITTEDALADFLNNYSVMGERRTKVVGVTFRNDNGTNRQTILSRCHAGNEITLRYFEYHGAPAYAIHTEHGQIGNLSAELAEELGQLGDNIYVSGRILAITGGYRGQSFGCNIALTFYRPNHV